MRIKKSVLGVILILWCFFTIACGSGGGDIPSPSDLIEEYTGNEDFKIEDAQAADPLNGYRVGDEAASNTLPSSIDYSDQMPEVGNQGSTSSCTAWAAGYYTKTYQEAKEMGWDPKANAFSPGFLFAVQCRTFKQPMDLNAAITVLKKIGIAKWDTMPFDANLASKDKPTEQSNFANVTIPEAAVEEAKIYRCGASVTLTDLVALKKALTLGPVPIVIHYYKSPGRNVSPEENYWRSDPNHNAAHAVACVGYDDQKFGEGAIKIVNSWGADHGESGFSWIKYADYRDIVYAAQPYEDLANPNHNTDPSNMTKRPAAPTDVAATDGAGNYVDITWSRVPGAQYYRILRTDTQFENPYAEVGVTYEGAYRDYPESNAEYYYAVVAVNDIGESEHMPNSTDADGYVDIGSAKGGAALQTPTLQWSTNDEEGSHFIVTDVDPAATAMEVFISTASEGPWKSLGWAKPGDFTLKLNHESEYGNKAPYVRVRVANADAGSSPSQAVQIGENINPNTQVGQITALAITPQADSIALQWKTDGSDNFQFFEIWRYCDSNNDQANDWIKIGYTNLADKDAEGYNHYEDTSALPGVPYYYVVAPVYEGTYGEPARSDTAYQIEDSGTNLHLTSFQYYYTEISPNTEFPEIVVRNDGATLVESFTLSVLAYDWTTREPILMGTWNVDHPLEAGQQGAFKIEYNIDSRFANGHRYSWGMMIDYENNIAETYEDDNLLWSKEAWWLPQAGAGADLRGAGSPTPRMGSSRPFSHKHSIVRSINPELQNVQDLGQGLVILDQGPITFDNPPAFCNNHAK